MNNGFGVSPLELMACDAMIQGVVFLDEFAYSASWIVGTPTALGSLGTAEIQILINGDSDFIVQEQNMVAWVDPHVLVADPDVLMTIIRAGSGRETSNQAQHVLNVLGSYSSNDNPGRRPMAGLWNAANTITIKLQNLSTVIFERIDIAFVGFKVFYTQGPDGRLGDRKSVFHAL